MITDINSKYLLKPLDYWMQDQEVSEIILNQPGIIFVERHNIFYPHRVPAFDRQRLQQLFRLIANENNQILNKESPLLSGKLKDGSRIQLVIPPISASPVFSIRIQRISQPSLENLYKKAYFNNTQPFYNNQNTFQTIDINNKKLIQYYQNKNWYNFIKLALIAKKNIVISGATSSGKTTFLNACLNQLPLSERLVILEDTPEVFVKHQNSIRLLAYKGQQSLSNITMQDLVQCSLRLRPDRIIVGEIRGKELLDFITDSLTGHGWSMTTVHAENPHVALMRMCQMYKLNALPAMSDHDIYKEIKQAIDIIFQLKQKNGERYLESVYFKLMDDTHA